MMDQSKHKALRVIYRIAYCCCCWLNQLIHYLLISRHIRFFVRSSSAKKMISLTFHLSQTIGEVKSDIQLQFGLHPSQYILKAGWKVMSKDKCSLADYNIQDNQTLDIVPRVNHPLLGGGGGGGTDNIVVTRQELECMKWDDIQTLLNSKGLSIRGRKSELIDRYVNAQAAGFPPKKKPMTSTERSATSRAKQSVKNKQKVQEKKAKRNAQVRAEERAADVSNHPTLDTRMWEEPGKDISLERHTENPIAAMYLLDVKSGCWIELEHQCLVAYIHVHDRLQKEEAIHKLDGLLQLSVERKETLLKTVDTIFDYNDRQDALAYKQWIKERDSRDLEFEEAVLEWFASTESISLDDRKSKLWNIESLVGLRLNVIQNWWVDEDTQKSIGGTKLWPGKIDRVSFNDGTDAKPSFIFKCDDKNYPDGYPIEYCDVKKYADKEDPKFSQFTLPEEPPCIYVDIELKALCDQTLQELNSKSLPVFFLRLHSIKILEDGMEC